MLNKISSFIEKIENSQITLSQYAVSFLCIVTLRNFLEMFSTHGPIGLPEHLHRYLFYIALTMSFILLLFWATKENIKKVSKVVLFMTSLILISPLIDLVLGAGRAVSMTYIYADNAKKMLLAFLTYCSRPYGEGITIGQKIEIAIILIFIFIYVWEKKRNLFRSLLAAFFAYVVLFAFSIVPFYITSIQNFFRLEIGNGGKLYQNFFAIPVLVLGALLAYVYNKKYFLAVLRDARYFKILFYLSMLYFGLALGGLFNVYTLTNENFLDLPIILISIIFAGLCAIVFNNLSDLEIDRISNKTRPLVTSAISLEIYRRLGYLFLFCALFFAFLVDYPTLFLIGILIGNYYLYSVEPFRFKRVTFFSKMTIAVNSLALIVLGFSTVTQTSRGFPILLLPFYFVFITAISNFLDINDYEGDKSEGIKTLPVVLGIKKTKYIVAGSSFLFFLSISLLLSKIGLSANWVALFVALGILSTYLILKKKFNEKWLIVLFALSMILIAFAVMENNAMFVSFIKKYADYLLI